MEKLTTPEEWKKQWLDLDSNINLDYIIAEAQNEVIDFFIANAKRCFKVDGIVGTVEVTIDTEWMESHKNKLE